MVCYKEKGTKMSLITFLSRKTFGVFRGASFSMIRNVSTVADSSDSELVESKTASKDRINKAMKAYLQRSKEHDEFIKQQTIEFNIGKKHLANMMGRDADTFTDKDIDESIEYLLPSGLYDKKARPMLKSPNVVYPKRKAAEFDETGRPHHYLFYTARPNFYQLLHNSVEQLEALNDYEDKMIRRHAEPDATQILKLQGHAVITKEILEKEIIEVLTDIEYQQFANLIDRIAAHPYSYRLKDFILQYKKPLMRQKVDENITEPTMEKDGRLSVTYKELRRKSASANVTMRYPGTGVVSINGQDILYFDRTQSREQILFPLQFTDTINKVDIVATVEGGGDSSQAGAIRLGIAKCLQSLVDKRTVEHMRVAGLLQKDLRRRERKKPGQEGARRKYTWKKR